MGLEFQSRSFVHLRGSDCLEIFGKRFSWSSITGRSRNFFHHCQHAKWSSYDAASHILDNINSLRHSFGFFSLTGDYYDCPDRDRAYVLGHGQLREVNTRNVLSREATPPGLYQHFEWCRTCFWGMDDENPFPLPPADVDRISGLDEPVSIAGWFLIDFFIDDFIDDEHDEFPSLIGLFPCRETVAVAQSSCSGHQYLVVGEEGIPLKDVLLPLLRASKRFPRGRGLLYLLGEPYIPQIAIAAGRCCTLAPLEPDQWSYHETPVFSTDGYGYEKR